MSSSEFSDMATAKKKKKKEISERLADCRVTAETANSSIQAIRSRISEINETKGTRKDD